MNTCFFHALSGLVCIDMSFHIAPQKLTCPEREIKCLPTPILYKPLATCAFFRWQLLVETAWPASQALALWKKKTKNYGYTVRVQFDSISVKIRCNNAISP